MLTLQIEMPFQSVTLRSTTNPSQPPNPAKQRSAFPPNFIHSLDSTHMMYTANACRSQGLCVPLV